MPNLTIAEVIENLEPLRSVILRDISQPVGWICTSCDKEFSTETFSHGRQISDTEEVECGPVEMVTAGTEETNITLKNFDKAITSLRALSEAKLEDGAIAKAMKEMLTNDYSFVLMNVKDNVLILRYGSVTVTTSKNMKWGEGEPKKLYSGKDLCAAIRAMLGEGE